LGVNNLRYKVARIHKPMGIEIVDWELPDLRPDEVLVRVLSCAICTSEQGVFKGERARAFPSYVGHEISGEVVEVGPEVVQDLKPKDHVAVSRMNRCEECSNCRRYMDNRCLNGRKMHRVGRPPGPGGFAQYIAVPGYQVFKFGKNVDKMNASLTEPVACCISSINKANIQLGDDVLVIGAGVMGLIHIRLAKLKGARVIVSEIDENRQKMALSWGADDIADPQEAANSIMSLTAGKGVESMFVTGGPTRIVPDLLKALTQGGTAVIYASYYGDRAGDVPIDLNLIHYSEINLTGSISPKKFDFQRAVNLQNQGALPLGELIQKIYPFQEIQSAYENAILPGTYRIVVDIGSSTE
jgi:2-desacetyl-2-hydroxyethyl bacteriochlorophyllide A dehydrogenase